ncbi:MAG: SUMF1/EgtB/PvdO family nonheme iron enzyme [Bacteroidia bacterium]|nr:SUMF1/EgtB/PvdO family nonheme iron enzyme [Bacteroidia bacterium]
MRTGYWDIFLKLGANHRRFPEKGKTSAGPNSTFLAMQPKLITDSIRSQIARDDLDGALKQLQLLLEGSPLLDEAILHAGSFADIRKQIRLGTVSSADAALTRSKIRAGLLDLLQEIERHPQYAAPGFSHAAPARVQAVNRRIIREQAPLRWHQRLLFGWLLDKRKRQEYALQVQGFFDASERNDRLKSLGAQFPIYCTDGSGTQARPFSDTFFQILDQPEHNGSIYLLLGETGTGKSTALLELFTRYALAQRRYHIVLVSFHKDLSAVYALPNPEQTILFLDGIDETQELLRDPDGFFTKVETQVQNFAKVIISCRTQFFKNKADERAQTNTRPTKSYQKIYLELLDLELVRKQAEKRYRLGTTEYVSAMSIAKQTGTLFRRPLLFSYLPDMVEKREDLLFFRVNTVSGQVIGAVTELEIYEIILNKWLMRENLLDPDLPGDYRNLIFEVSKKLALAAFYPEGRKHVYYADLPSLIDQHQLPISETLLRDRSLLRRDDQGNYSFAHRTFKEFFFAHLLYEGLIPEDEFPFDAYEDAGRFYSQMGEVRYFQHPARRRLSRGHTPGELAFHASSLLPRPVQAFCELEQIPRSSDSWGIFSDFLSRGGLHERHKACLVALAYDLVTEDLDSVSEARLREICTNYRVSIGDLLQAFFFRKTGERYGFIHRAFAEHLCLRYLISEAKPAEAASHFPLDKLRFTRLFREELRWLDLLRRYGESVALRLDNYEISPADLGKNLDKKAFLDTWKLYEGAKDHLRRFGEDISSLLWPEYVKLKSSATFPDFYPRLERGGWRLCIRTQAPPDLDFLACIPFAEQIEELDLSHNALQGQASLAHFTALKKLRLAGNPGLRLTALPPSLEQVLLSERDGTRLPPGFQDKAVFRETLVRRLAGEGLTLPEMLPVAGGRFWMGSADDDLQAEAYEKPQHLVEAGDFHIGKYPVTVREFACFVRDTGYVTIAERDGWTESTFWEENTLGNTLKEFLCIGVDWTCDVYGGKMDEAFAWYPVTYVSWHDTEAYCAWLNGRSGQTWRLPSEAEWEYAAIGGQASGCRDEAGNIVREYEFAGDPDAKEVAWHWEKFIHAKAGHHEFTTQAVGLLKPNALGLYDMNGNVEEICEDHFHMSYEEAPSQAIAWVELEVSHSLGRICRGGSWRTSAKNSRVSSRSGCPPPYRNSYVGFRLVFVP